MAEFNAPVWFNPLSGSIRAAAMAAGGHPADEPSDEEPDVSQRPTRQRKPRGGQAVEVTGAPERETR